MPWIIEPEDEATDEAPPLPVGVPIMVVGLPDGSLFEGLVTGTPVSLHQGYFRVVVELRNENIVNRHLPRIRRWNPENRVEGEEEQ
jgi:hypothetical protein